MSNLKHEVPPKVFLGLLAKELPVKKVVLEQLQQMFEGVQVLEAAARVDQGVTEMLKTMEWPFNRWSRQNLSYLSEGFFLSVYPWLHKELHWYGLGHHSSLECELLFNTSRKQCRNNPKGSLEPQTMWHSHCHSRCHCC